jgi:hypothetical protein
VTKPMSLLERLLFLVLGLLVVAALVLLLWHDLGRNATPKPPAGTAAHGRFWWQ